MSDQPKPAEAARRWTATELRRLPPDQRNAILGAVADQAAAEYRHNRELTDFDAFGEDDLHGDSADTETR